MANILHRRDWLTSGNDGVARKKTVEIEYNPDFVGYARVSTVEQNLDMQVTALERAGVDPDVIFVEKVSGVAKRRPARDKARRQLRPGMTLVVWKLDRLGRNAMDLYGFVKGLADDGIAVRSVTEHIDTSSPIGNFVLLMLAGSAQLERDTITERIRAGVKRAQERGVKFGADRKITADVERSIEKWVAAGDSIGDIAKRIGVSKPTVRNYFPLARLEAIRAGKQRRK